MFSQDGLILHWFPIHTGTSWWREALRELSVLPKNTTQCPQPGLQPRPLDLEMNTPTMKPPCNCRLFHVFLLKLVDTIARFLFTLYYFAVHFHNEFLLAILAKCQALGSTPGGLMILVVTNAIFSMDSSMLKLYCFDLDLVHIA